MKSWNQFNQPKTKSLISRRKKRNPHTLEMDFQKT